MFRLLVKSSRNVRGPKRSAGRQAVAFQIDEIGKFTATVEGCKLYNVCLHTVKPAALVANLDLYPNLPRF